VEWTPTPEEPLVADVAFSPHAFAGATAMFVVFGSVASLYGPLLVTFAHRFSVSLATAGAILSVHFIGAFAGVPLGWAAMRRWRGQVVLAAALAVLALGAGLAGLSRGFAELLGSVLLIGLGFGALDFLLNSLLVRTAADGRAHRISVANAGYGVGSVIGPLLIIVARPTHYPLLLAAVALGALSLAFSTRGVTAPPLSSEHRRTDSPRRRAVLATFIVAYVLYVATEASLTGWIAPQLHRVGYSQTVGAVATAGFWLGLALGRVLAGPAHRFLSEERIVLGGLLVTAALCALAHSDAVAPITYPLAGLSIALVYPMGLIWYTRLAPGDGDGVALLILTMMIGGVIGPALTSALVSMEGVRVVPLCVCALALITLIAFLSARRFAAGVVAPRGARPLG
jgi:FHS family glucose/mannose:H+ symporter-like MFS transporter